MSTTQSVHVRIDPACLLTVPKGFSFFNTHATADKYTHTRAYTYAVHPIFLTFWEHKLKSLLIKPECFYIQLLTRSPPDIREHITVDVKCTSKPVYIILLFVYTDDSRLELDNRLEVDEPRCCCCCCCSMNSWCSSGGKM